MKIKTGIFATILLLSGFFVQHAQADSCTSAFRDGGYACLDVNNQAATKNIFDTGTACQTGYCSGGSNIQCCRTTCNSDEECMGVVEQGGKLMNPSGYSCTDRGVCSTGRACCKAVGAAQGGGAAGGGTPTGPTTFANPLAFDTVDGLVTNILTVLQRIVVVLSLVFIVIGALLYITSAGDSKRTEQGKQAITAALIGLAIVLGAPSLLNELGGIIGWGGADTSIIAGKTSLSVIAINVLNFLLGLLGILALIMLVIGGAMYLTSAGDEDRIDTGKKIFKYSLIGVVIAMSANVLVHQIAAFFSIQ